MKNYLAILVFVSVLVGCRPQETNNNTAIKEVVAKGDSPTTQKERDQIFANSFPQHKEVSKILLRLLSSNKLTPKNRTFLLKFYEQIKGSQKNIKPYSFNQVLSPIYYYDYRMCIVSHNDFDKSTQDNILISQLVEKIGNIDSIILLDPFETFYESFSNNDSFYVYTSRDRINQKVALDSFGFELTDCSFNNLFPIANQLSNLLISSTVLIDLEFGNYPKFDTLIQKQANINRGDCPNSWDQEKAFAKLKGCDNIYFTYVDEASGRPLRSIVYVNQNGIAQHIWFHDLDEPSCECL